MCDFSLLDARRPGDGTANDGKPMVSIPKNMCYLIQANTQHDNTAEQRSMEEFCNTVFPDLPTNINTYNWLDGRSILAPTNIEVDLINDFMETWMPGTSTVLTSADTFENSDDYRSYNVEILKKKMPQWISQACDHPKEGMPLMLLRKISPKEGLCNGTKLIFHRTLNNKLLLCTVGGTQKQVLIPRIKFIHVSNRRDDCDWARRQFPVRVAFATTINKSQGQTLTRVGVWLSSPVFSHGQLYVASSRTGNPENLTYAIKQQEGQPEQHTANVIFQDLLRAVLPDPTIPIEVSLLHCYI